MLFNSIDFAVFLPLVFLLYWFVLNRSLRLQNAFLIASGFVFYGWWDWRFLGLLIFTSGTDYLVALGLDRSQDERRRKLLLGVSLVANLGLLGFFKYYDFFITSFHSAFTILGLPFGLRALGLVLPVGISFYTFQSLSYTIDVYRRQLKATEHPVTFFAFVSFFPQMLAGPIERARQMIPQFEAPRTFDLKKASDGLRQMLWGLFKKMVIADNCATEVDRIFSGHADMDGSTLLLGALLFAFQIYGDFSGYSDIAIGCARLFGFQLMRNFAYPYFSRDIAEFWRRWHISLSTWFRDYLYVPLGGSRGGAWLRVRNTFIIFLVSGLWHGANWTFIVWGALNALYFLPLLLGGTNRRNMDTVATGRLLPSPLDALRILGTFLITCLAWVFFRARDLNEAFAYIHGMFSSTILKKPTIGHYSLPYLLLFFVVMEWLGRNDQHPLQRFGLAWPRVVRWAAYIFLIMLIGVYMATGETPFIYFQF
jgi:D-alanyl-lipoteichoic acid acyltransferase DltB (MBOAT superfamily)